MHKVTYFIELVLRVNDEIVCVTKRRPSLCVTNWKEVLLHRYCSNIPACILQSKGSPNESWRQWSMEFCNENWSGLFFISRIGKMRHRNHEKIRQLCLVLFFNLKMNFVSNIVIILGSRWRPVSSLVFVDKPVRCNDTKRWMLRSVGH